MKKELQQPQDPNPLISKVMGLLGARTSDRKRSAAQRNGKLGGRPKKPLDPSPNPSAPVSQTPIQNPS